MELCVLASGSAGNSAILRSGQSTVAIDLGLGPRSLQRRMTHCGTRLDDISAAVLTHLDRDHFSPAWLSELPRRQVRLFVHRSRYRDVLRHDHQFRVRTPEFARWVRTFDDLPFELAPNVRVTPVQVAHDQLGSHAFVIDTPTGRLGWASDLGQVPARLLEQMCGVDILAIESNYDPHLQLSSTRPEFLKRRIMGGRGHLSNAQALRAVTQVLDRCQRDGNRLPAHVVLLHRSRQCNCATLLRELFHQDARLRHRLTLAEQNEATRWLSVSERAPGVGEQLELVWA